MNNQDLGCFLLKFYIKPQLYKYIYINKLRCFLLKFYIKPQLVRCLSVLPMSCFLLKFYIKPQQGQYQKQTEDVVSY